MSNGGSFLNNSLTIYAKFENVEGLLIGNNVRYAGANVGTVTDIEMISDHALMVTLSLDKGIKDYMKSNAEADITTNGLVGNVLINITPSHSEAPAIKDGDIIKNKETVELADMITTLSATNEKISQIAESMLQIAQKMNDGDGTISQLLNDNNLADNLKSATHNLSIASQNIMMSTNNVNSLISDVTQGEGNLGYLLKDNSIKDQISLMSNNMHSLINERTEPILKNLESSSTSIYNTSTELESIITNLDNNEGLLGTLMNDEKIVDDIKNSIDNLNGGMQKFDESMDAVQKNWLLRRHLKKINREE